MAIAAKRPLSHFLGHLVGSKAVVRFLSRLNVLVYRASGGRLMNSVDGRPVCLVTLTRRRSRTVTTLPLMYVPHGDYVLLVGSLGGSDHHPLWYHNLKAEPKIMVQVGTKRRAMVAHEAAGAERAALWPVAVAAFPSYAAYQRKTSRVLPVMVCTPLPEDRP